MVQSVVSFQDITNELNSLQKMFKDLSENDVIEEKLTKLFQAQQDFLLHLLDNVSDVIYIVDPKTNEIVYVNKAIQEIFGDVIGKKCYKALQNLDGPCSFCTNKDILGENYGKKVIWEHHNKNIDQWFKCNDTAIEWFDGRKLRFEYATNITKDKIFEFIKEFQGELNKTIDATKTYDELIDIIISLFSEVFDYPFVTYLVYDEKDKVYTPFKFKGFPNEIKDKKLVLTKGKLKSAIFDTGMNKTKAKKSVHKEIKQYSNTFMIKSYAAIPLSLSKGTSGVLFFGDENARSSLQQLESEFDNIALFISKSIEQKLLEFDLLRKETALESSLTAITISDPYGNIEYVNQAFADIFRLPNKESYIGKHFRDISFSSDETVVKKVSSTLFKNGIYDGEFVAHRADDSIFDLRLKANVILDKDKKPICLMGLIEDISAQKQAERALMESEERYRSLTEFTTDWIWTIDKNGFYTYSSQKVEELIGYTSDEVTGKTPFDFMSEEEANKLKKIFEKIVKTKKPFHNLENTLIHKNGQRVVVETSGIPLFDEKGKYAGYRGVDRDITERKEITLKIQESENKYRSLFENMRTGFALHKMLFTKDGKPDNYIFLEVNDSFEELTGLTKEMVIGKKVTEVLPIENKDEFDWRKKYGDVVLTGKDIQFEQYSETLGRWYNILAYAVDEAHFVTLFFDITDRVKLESELKEQEDHYKGLFKHNQVGIGIIHPDGTIAEVNQALLDLLGYTMDELRGKTLFDITLEKWHKMEKELFENEFLKRGYTDEYEREYYHKDGSIVPVTIKGWTIYNDDGSPKHFCATIRDLTQMKKKEKELKEQEERYRKLFSLNQDGIGILDLKGKVVEVNQAFLEMLGYEEEELSQKDFEELSVEKWIEKDREMLTKQFMQRGFTDEYEKEYYHKDGSIISVSMKGWTIYDENNKPKFMAMSLRDLTLNKKIEKVLEEHKNNLEKLVEERTIELKQTNELLHKEEDRFRTLFDESPISLMEQDFSELKKYLDELKTKGIKDFNTYFTDYPEEVIKCSKLIKTISINRATLKLIKARNKSQFMNNIDSYFTEESAITFKKQLVALANGNYDFVDETMYRNLNGEKFYAILNIHIPKAYKKTFEKALVSLLDISDRKQFEGELETSRRKYKNLYDFAPVGLFNSSVKSGKITNSNDTLARILDYKNASELIGLPASIFYDNPDTRQEFINALASNEAIKGFEVPIRKKNGELKWVSIDAHLYFDEDTIEGAVVDVTERKFTQLRLEQTLKELRRSNEELQQFAYVSSHDLQEPLRMITSFLQLIERELQDKMTDELQEYIDFAIDGSSRLKTLINDLLSYSRVTSKAKSFKKVDFSVSLANAMDNLKLQIDETKTEISFSDLPNEVQADETQITQLLQNLMSNSMKFKRENVKPKIHLLAEDRGDEFLFKIKDNGIGIPEEFRDNIFVIFKRLHGKESYEGTGIGLAICKKIVERHGGNIWVESDGKTGSTFYFTIKKRRMKNE